jgi:hypothetical protein
MDKIAEKFGVKTTEEEINGHIAQLAIQRKVRPERLKEEMTRDGSLDQFKLQVREQKCVAKLLETAKITEVERPVVSKVERKAEGRIPARREKGGSPVAKAPAKSMLGQAKKRPSGTGKPATKAESKEKGAKKRLTRKKKT